MGIIVILILLVLNNICSNCYIIRCSDISWAISYFTDFLITMPQKILSGIDSFTLLAIPLFIFAGTIMGQGIAGRIVNMSLVLFAEFVAV